MLCKKTTKSWQMLGMMCFFTKKITNSYKMAGFSISFMKIFQDWRPSVCCYDGWYILYKTRVIWHWLPWSKHKWCLEKKAIPLFIPKLLSRCMPLQPPTKHTSPGISTDKLWLVNQPPQTYPPTIKALFSKGLLTIGSLNKALLNSYFWGWYVREGLVD